MSSSLKLLSKIDRRTKCGVSGWIRETEQELNMRHTPMIIVSMCILFYREDDLFNCSHLTPTDFVLSPNQKLVTNLKSTFTPIYGTVEIDSTIQAIYEWNYKIKRCTAWIDFGISSWIATSNFLRRRDGYIYGLYSHLNDNHIQTFRGCEGSCIHEHITNFKSLVPGDVIYVRFDVGQKEIIFGVNDIDTDRQIIIENIEYGKNIKYRAIVVLSEIENAVEMVRFIKTDTS